jgi:CheY-like chemotaxis protein
LPVAVQACVSGVVTHYDAIAATLVVQDQAGAVKFDNVSGMPPWGPRYGQHLEICGETRGAQSGMTLAKPSFKSLGTADLPVSRRHSPGEWSKGRVDWQWIEVEGIVYALTIDRMQVSTLHMVMQGRRMRVRILGTEGDQRMEHLVGVRVPEDAQFLVVDDNETNRRILRDLLAKYGAGVAVADSAQAALALMRERAEAGKPVTLLVTDGHMPEMDGFALASEVKGDPKLAGAAIMLLTSAGQRGDGARCRDLGISAYLNKPVSQSELREAIFMMLDRQPADGAAAGLITRHAIREKVAARSLKILLAEDNVVNLKLAVRMLEKRGHRVTVAGTGREAVDALQAEEFDLVLMDIQMPEMDGFEATAAIRQSERGTGRHQPIVAMTAHAMKGDDQRCVDAGMDGYLAKPIRRPDLYALLEGFQDRN